MSRLFQPALACYDPLCMHPPVCLPCYPTWILTQFRLSEGIAYTLLHSSTPKPAEWLCGGRLHRRAMGGSAKGLGRLAGRLPYEQPLVDVRPPAANNFQFSAALDGLQSQGDFLLANELAKQQELQNGSHLQSIGKLAT